MRLSILPLVALVLLRFSPECALAQFDPRAPEPISGIKGSLVLGGGGELPEAVLERFAELAGGRDARLVVLLCEGKDSFPRSSWRAIRPAGVVFLDTNASPSLEGLFSRPPTGVWLETDDPLGFLQSARGTGVEKAIRSVIDRGGVVGGNAEAAVLLAEKLIPGEGGEIRVEEGLGLLPGSVVEPHFDAEKTTSRLRQVLGEQPDLVGFGIEEGTALVLSRRSVTAVGRGSVHAHIAGSGTRPPRLDRIQGRVRADLIALSRSAVARVRLDPESRPSPPVVKGGALVVCGGGGLSSTILKKFIELAGGPTALIVYIPCTPELEIRSEPGFLSVLRRSGARNTTWIHTKDRTRATSDKTFLEPLTRAGGIWFGGGRQWNLVDSYQNTTAHKLMHQVLERGGVIGGSSAGASIQADYMCRGDPLGNLNIIAEGYEKGLGFITGVAVDQHFTQRRRQKDMILLVDTYPHLLGIGLDEGTAIVVRGSMAEVFGPPGRSVHFYDRRQPVPPGEKDGLALPPGQLYDLKARRVVN